MNLGSSMRRAGFAATAVVAGLAVAGPAAASTALTERVSVSSAGDQGDGNTIAGDLSADGRYLVFDSSAATLVPGDTNNRDDVFLRDRQTGTTTRISVSPTGEQADGASDEPRISADGRFVTYISYAPNLVATPRTDIAYDVYLYDRLAGTTTRISQTAAGVPADGDSFNPTISGDGRYVAFETYGGNLLPGVSGDNAVLYDRTTGGLSLISAAPDGSDAGGFSPEISDSGQFVAFVSSSGDLAPGDTNNRSDIYVRDLATGTNVRASLSASGGQLAGESRGGVVSDDGRYVAFWTRDTGVVPGDTNGESDVFVRDLVAGTTILASASTTGTVGDGNSSGPAITPDGRYVTFSGDATNLVAGDTNGHDDVFRRDLRTGTTILVSQAADGTQGNGDSANGILTPDGRTALFGSFASNLVPGDTNDDMDLFLTTLPS